MEFGRRREAHSTLIQHPVCKSGGIADAYFKGEWKAALNAKFGVTSEIFYAVMPVPVGKVAHVIEPS
jgi:hypothetical protein